MVRDISSLNTPQLGASQTRNSKTQASQSAGTTEQAAPAASAKTAPDTVSISSQGKALAELENRIAKMPDVDMERVEKLKKAIGDGSYQVDAERLADKILTSEKDFQ